MHRARNPPAAAFSLPTVSRRGRRGLRSKPTSNNAASRLQIRFSPCKKEGWRVMYHQNRQVLAMHAPTALQYTGAITK